jgi:hypothetical protein
MPSPLPLLEIIKAGSRNHPLRLSDANYWINRLAEVVQLSSQGAGQQWLWVIPNSQTGKGLIIQCNATSLFAAFEVQDKNGANIFDVLPSGGAGVTSANAGADGLWVSNNVTGRAGFWNTNGGLRLAKGDPAGGVEILAIGDATTAPTGNPDGSHTAETNFATVAGALIWGPSTSGGRLHLRTRAGHEVELADVTMRRQARIDAPGGGTTLVATGTALPTVATTNITATPDDTAAGPGIAYTTTAATSVDAGWLSAFGIIQPRWAAFLYTKFTTDAAAITSTRLAIGLTSAELAADAGPASTGAYTAAAGAWFRYDTSVDGTAFWRCVTGNGTTATVTTTTAAIAAATTYELRIEIDSTAATVRFYVNVAGSAPVLVATHTTNLPAASTALGTIARLRTLTTSARALRLVRQAWSSL